MARKQIFKSRKGSEVLLGGKRRFLELEGPPEDGVAKSSERPSRTRRLPRLSGLHAVLILLGAAVLAFLVWFLFFALPSPVAKIIPPNRSYVRTRAVEVRVSLKKGVKASQVEMKLDGKSITNQVSFSGNDISYGAALEDGSHRLTVTVNSGGLMGKRTVECEFKVDTTLPRLTITSKAVRDLKGSKRVEVSFSGKTEKGNTVKVEGRGLKVDGKGNFKGSAEASRMKSLKIQAWDPAGNESSA